MKKLLILIGIAVILLSIWLSGCQSQGFQVRRISEEPTNYVNMTEEHIFDGVKGAFAEGIESIKLYFMLGLPGCEDEDEAESIILLLKKIMNLPKILNITQVQLDLQKKNGI